MLILSAYVRYTLGLRFVYIGYNNIDTSIVIDIMPFHSFVRNILKNIEDLLEYIYIYCYLCLIEENVNITFNTYIILMDNKYIEGI